MHLGEPAPAQQAEQEVAIVEDWVPCKAGGFLIPQQLELTVCGGWGVGGAGGEQEG